MSDAPDITPLIKNGLITNAYNNELGRGGYFHPNSGTSEGEAIMIIACFRAASVLYDGTDVEANVASYYLALALQMLDALGTGSPTGPMLRQPIPTDPNVITPLHWLFAARGDIPGQAIVFDLQTDVANNSLYITSGYHPEGVYRVWKIYPATSSLLYPSPYSAAYDNTLPTVDTSIIIDASNTSARTWYTDGGGNVVIPLPSNADPSITTWKVVYGYSGAGVILEGQAEEAYPCWTPLADGYSSCAPDTFRWFEQALTLAIQYDDRPGKATDWTNLRAASSRTAVRGQSLTDKREVFKPMAGFDAIPGTGDPTGMFCYSNHPAATPPANTSLNQGWLGYNFWSRDSSGNIVGTIPNSTSAAQVQLGRGFNDTWRTATNYQLADQYLYVTVSCTKKPDLSAGEHFYVFLSSTQYYSNETRWYADIGIYTQFVSGTAPVEFFIPITDFKRTDFDNAVLSSGTKFENFGISSVMTGAYNITLGNMRLVSSSTTKSAALPYFPGSMPFDISADTIKQAFVGFSGNPFQGYQLPDLWWFLGDDANYVHPGLTPSQLPLPDPANMVPAVYTITARDNGGNTKPANALLMEQQLHFLRDAQSQYSINGGQLGPLAHTYVINTPDRQTIGNPTPGTWVYINDDPNTRWIGYQTRVVESLATLVVLVNGEPGFYDCTAIAKPILVNWLTWLNGAWPNLNGTIYAGKTYYGMPTEYDDPRVMPHPVVDYEEPHAAALILRSCMMLKSVDPSYSALCDALITRCWTYLELLYVTTPGTLNYTWSPDVSAQEWYGFWHGEIISTLAYMCNNSSVLPTGVDASIARRRLAQTQTWLGTTGIVVPQPYVRPIIRHRGYGFII